jgi:predicted alternative tryptophan synthase beta-subunit
MSWNTRAAIHVVANVVKLLKPMNTTYMQSKKHKPCTEKYIWFDYEAQQDTGVHKPNLIVAHYFDSTKFCFKTN